MCLAFIAPPTFPLVGDRAVGPRRGHLHLRLRLFQKKRVDPTIPYYCGKTSGARHILKMKITLI